MIVDANPLVLILKNFKGRVKLEVFDADEEPVDASELELQVQKRGSVIVYEDDLQKAGTRIKKTATGKYYLLWGDPNASANKPIQTETATTAQYMFVWNVVGPAGTEDEQVVQTVEVISSDILRVVSEFRDQVDKSIKDVNVKPDEFCPLGYTDGQLLRYLRGGMELINAYQPYPTWCALESFPEAFKQNLFDAGMIVAVNAQTLFAIDSDVENWSDQGNAFVINHTPKLAAFNAALAQRLDKLIPMMKLHFVRSGSVKTEMGAGFRLNTLVDMSPNGALFRNYIMKR